MRRLMHSNATRALLQGSGVPGTAPAPLAVPEVISAAEQSIVDLQGAVSEYARALRDRAEEGSATSQDMKLTHLMSQAAVKLAQEERERRAEVSLALQSDEDILQLVVSAILAIPNGRGVDILRRALAQTTSGATSEA